MARIAVLGATGYLGGHAVTRLLADGHTVRAVVRSPETAQLPAGIEVVQGDVTEPSTLPAALADADGVLLALNGGSDTDRAIAVEETGVANVAAAAQLAGVQQILLLTGMYSQPAYAEHPWEEAKSRGAELLLAGPVPATVFRIGFIDETLPQFVRGGGVTMLGKQALPVRPIAADDIMAAASRAFGLPETAGKTYDVAGTEEMTLREAAVAYASAVTSTPPDEVKVRVMPLPFMRTINRLFMGGRMTRVLGIMGSMDRLGDVTDTTAFFRDLGEPPTSFREWLEKQRRAIADGVAPR